MQSIVSKGKNVKEAIQVGLELMEATKSEVNIEIQQQETKGIMGIGGKEAVVKITRIKGQDDSERDTNQEGMEHAIPTMEDLVEEISDSSEGIEQEHSSPIDGPESVTKQKEETQAEKAWVKEGRIHVQDSPSQFPTISIGDYISVMQNNERVQKDTLIVSEKDTLEVQFDHEEQETKWEISMDQQRLNVTLQVEPGYKITRTLQDVEPGQHIKLTAEEHKETVNTLSYGDILNKLESLQVRHGFHQGEIIKATEAKEASTYEIARGTKAKQGKNGWIELKVDVDTRNGLVENEAGEIDFRESKMIPTVDKGKVIAVIHPPVPGQPGITVTNEPLPAKQTHPIVIKAGKGVTQVDDKIVAMESGRPVIEQRGMLVHATIMPKLVHRGNVNLSSGNIHFNGDVEVIGEIEETMLVEADGDVFIHRSVDSATVTSLRSIIARGSIINSELSAGKNNMLVAELGHLLGIMRQKVERMIAVINQLTQASAFKSNDVSRNGIQPLIHILLEKKFQDFVPMIKKYVGIVKKGDRYLEDKNWRRISASLTNIFLSLSNQMTTVEQIVQLSRQMEELYEYSQTPIEPDSYITVSSSLNSYLYSSGDITIIGQGSINSKIHAGGTLEITGILRGGEVYGRLGVKVHEVGSDSGTKTLISVPYDQVIHIDKAMEGTVLKIGNASHVVNETTYDLKAKIDKNGRITFE